MSKEASVKRKRGDKMNKICDICRLEMQDSEGITHIIEYHPELIRSIVEEYFSDALIYEEPIN